MLDKLDSEYGDIVDFLNGSWFSCTATLKIFWNLISKIQKFLKGKEQDNTIFDDK